MFCPRQILPPKGAPITEADALPQTLWHTTRWCHVLVGLGRGADSLHAKVEYGVSAQPALHRTFWSHTTQYVARHGTAPRLVGGDFNFDLDYPLRAPPSVLASLLTRRLVDVDLGLAPALGRDPLCSYHGPEAARPSRIDGLLVESGLRRCSMRRSGCRVGHFGGTPPYVSTSTCGGVSQRVVKFVRPKPVVPA